MTSEGMTSSSGNRVEPPLSAKDLDHATTNGIEAREKGDEEPTTTTQSSEDNVPKVAGSVCEAKALVERFNKDGEAVIIEKDSKADTSTDPYVEYAIVSKQTFDEKQKLTGTTLEMNSPSLLAALEKVITYYPGENLDFSTKFSIQAPYKMLMHHRAALAEYVEKTELLDSTTKAHVLLLLKHLEKEAGDKGMAVINGIKSGLVSFDALWMAFKPGELLYEHKHGHSRLFQLRKTGYSEHKDLGPYFEISCVFVSFDGIKVGTANDKLRIYERVEFLGRSPSAISSLSVFPLCFLEEQERQALLPTLIDRGRRYLEIKERSVMQYDGLYLYLKRPPREFYSECADYSGSWVPETTTGRMVIDPKTFNEESRAQKEEVSCGCADEEGDEKKGDENSEQKSALPDRGEDILGDEQDPVLCPPYIYGFSLEKKEWCRLFIDSMSEVKWKANALDSLILPAPQKRLLQGLVTAHKFPVRARDEVGLKGKGLVVLLHGTPGSGKTLTAEMTAEHTHRALLNISTGELGSWQYFIEMELKRLLTYASTFQAIVLIDEADIFLEARTSGASDRLEQNAMVAVFLRQLEYFQGIIFLTSNRIAVFDQAVKSRIHLALQYQPPSAQVRRLLWRQHLARVPAAEIAVEIETAVDAMERVEMNGREISNSITTARTLAESEGQKLGLEYLQSIVQVWEEFEVSLGRAKSVSEV